MLLLLLLLFLMVDDIMTSTPPYLKVERRDQGFTHELKSVKKERFETFCLWYYFYNICYPFNTQGYLWNSMAYVQCIPMYIFCFNCFSNFYYISILHFLWAHIRCLLIYYFYQCLFFLLSLLLLHHNKSPHCGMKKESVLSVKKSAL